MTQATTLREPSTLARKAPPALSMFEFWPGWLFYTPIVLYWIAMGLRYRDFSIPTAANPRVTTGGLCGESKVSILDQAGEVARRWIAPYASFVTGRDDASAARAAMASADLAFPLVVKPDIGCNGTGVKLVRDETALLAALPTYPRGVRLMLQALVDEPEEAGLFYIRDPQTGRGRITSITYKKVPVLTGDGRSTIRELIEADPRTRLVPHLYLPRLRERADDVPSTGEPVPLVFAGNHCKGSIFLNGTADATPDLEAQLDEVMRDIPDFHFGRVDVKFSSVAALRRGIGFTIIEVNGIGSEATHIWDRETTLREAYMAQFRHYHAAFVIGAKNRKAGWRTSGAFTMLRYWRLQRRLLASYPMND
ncbi:D-alanine--D-alanine ligase [Ameyamaea chiangmaiensis NBRC 103196]|uniref:D-alanine--D-alanine ligase n=1 Tax=Ameyamaea chiangmaiensis TaxID=442969 RepID=A0A850PEZ0_9PROT|nr:D-alanine--D-alanine ligase [Ameyamaea chiangmaiensis]MBS4073592.1 D-alanine--D-alanine ligase [Ameyamaea chiangmaiensis]NVN40472.1 D-alanine--D-alanine ligase [Ameyamaea chiangmaiensis]GBQ69144.1 D-alanine--D-alanine ligase [Ameyamaea chiangmaiensis NBRC 103196]